MVIKFTAEKPDGQPTMSEFEIHDKVRGLTSRIIENNRHIFNGILVQENLIGNLQLILHVLKQELLKVVEKMKKPQEKVKYMHNIWDSFRCFEHVSLSPSNEMSRTVSCGWDAPEDPLVEIVQTTESFGEEEPPAEIEFLERRNRSHRKKVPMVYAAKRAQSPQMVEIVQSTEEY